MSPTRVRGTSGWRWLRAPLGSGSVMIADVDGQECTYIPDASGMVAVRDDHVAQLLDLGWVEVPEPGDDAE